MAQYDFEKNCFMLDGKSIEFTEAELQSMLGMRWYQAIPFSEQILSPGTVYPRQNPAKYFLDKITFTGQSILGIGCYEGFQLYVAEGKGAGRIVGVSDDLGLYPAIEESRRFTKEKLKSNVEFIDIKLDDLTCENVGMFDVVFFFDAITHLKHPLLTFEKIAKLSKSVLLVTSPFVLSNFNVPWVSQQLNYELEGYGRNYSVTNREWITATIDQLGFERGAERVWEHDHLSVAAARSPRKRRAQRSITELPTDHEHEERTVILVMSCYKYREAWEPFFTLFKRYWPDCPYQVYLVTEKGSYPGVETIELAEDKHWASNCLTVMNKLSADRIILFQEDFLLLSPVNTEIIRKLAQHAAEFEIGCLRLCPIPGPTARWYATDYLGTIGALDSFRFSFQLTLWKKSLYMSLLQEGEDPWTTEYVAQKRAVLCNEPFVCIWSHNPNPIPYLAYAIDKGEWQDNALELLKHEGIDTSKLSRKVGAKKDSDER